MSWAEEQLEQLGKAAMPPGDDWLEEELVKPFIDELREGLEAGAAAGAADGGWVIGVSYKASPAGAAKWAAERAAELVGMKLQADGSLIPNPNAQWQITETLRLEVRELVAEAIDGGWGVNQLKARLRGVFGDWRAETIARSETADAYNEGTAAVYEESGAEFVEIVDGPGCLPTGHEDGAPPAKEGQLGIVQEGAQAHGQIWTLEQFRARKRGHPNCTRAGLPYFTGEQEEAA